MSARTERIRELARRGVGVARIAAIVEVTPSTVQLVLARRDKRGRAPWAPRCPHCGSRLKTSPPSTTPVDTSLIREPDLKPFDG
jgi:hypothetical protein